MQKKGLVLIRRQSSFLYLTFLSLSLLHTHTHTHAGTRTITNEKNKAEVICPSSWTTHTTVPISEPWMTAGLDRTVTSGNSPSFLKSHNLGKMWFSFYLCLINFNQYYLVAPLATCISLHVCFLIVFSFVKALIWERKISCSKKSVIMTLDQF